MPDCASQPRIVHDDGRDVATDLELNTENLRRGTRVRNLTNMWWSSRHSNVRVRYNTIDVNQAKRDLLQRRTKPIKKHPVIFLNFFCGNFTNIFELNI